MIHKFCSSLKVRGKEHNEEVSLVLAIYYTPFGYRCGNCLPHVARNSALPGCDFVVSAHLPRHDGGSIPQSQRDSRNMDTRSCSSLAIDAIVASIALYAGTWSPAGILYFLISICIIGVTGQFHHRALRSNCSSRIAWKKTLEGLIALAAPLRHCAFNKPGSFVI